MESPVFNFHMAPDIISGDSTLVREDSPFSAPVTTQTGPSPPLNPIRQETPPTAAKSPGSNSLHAILSSTKPNDVPSNGQLPPWNASVPQPQRENGVQLVSSSTGKRKLEDHDAEDPHTKIRRIVRDHVSSTDPARVMPMTTVICLHAAVAQKSYGSEKRFLCPPPVVHVDGPVWQMRQQVLSMSVVSETGDRANEQRAPLDNNMAASFKFLHVTGTAKAKHFQLSLDIGEPSPNSHSSDENAPPGRVWASFDSALVTIISKPSKKTAKTRNISSCILAGGPVSLFNRINSQTVRTKYMTIDNGQFCASNVAWSAFNVNVVQRSASEQTIAGPQPVTYGSQIVLSDTNTGISTAPLLIRKVDKGRVSSEDGGPVSQMQKVALQRVNADGTRHYLSASGPNGQAGIMPPPAPGMATQAGTHPLLFQAPRLREETKDGVRLVSDEVDDYLCWTIVGISKFQYTFFDAFGQNNTIPEQPITPFPTLFTTPVYRQANNIIELTVSNFFYEDPKTRQQVPLDVYLGNLGPLRHRVYQASPPFVQPLSGAEGADAGRYMPPGPLHTIVIVEMPGMAEVIKALEEDALPGSTDTRAPAATEEPVTQATLAGKSLPLLFIRSSDGVGYHSGRTIACENVFTGMDLGASPSNGDPNWLAAAHAAAAVDAGNLASWTLRVM